MLTISRLVAGVVAGLCLLGTLASDSVAFANASPAPGAAQPCAPLTPGQPPPAIQPTTITTLGQAYRCIFDHYFSGATLDDRTLLVGAFAGLTQELMRRGLDQQAATLPALTGDRGSDWQAFSEVYQRLIGALPDDQQLRQAVASATMNGMMQTLHDDHARWSRPGAPIPPEILKRYPHGFGYGLGIRTSPEPGHTQPDAQPPLFIFSVTSGSPAAERGLRAGDVIQAIDGAPPFTDGQANPGVMALLGTGYPDDRTRRLTLRRPSTGRVWNVDLKPDFFAPHPAPPGKLLDGEVAYVQLPGFGPNATDMVLQAVSRLGSGHQLRGLILDLRHNGGGSPVEVGRLLGAFVHGKIWSYDVDGGGNRVANHTDDTVPLLHLPLVVLTDRSCASACDAFSAAVKDLNAGKLVGTRTSGTVSGAAEGYVLDDASMLIMPARHQVGANGEIIDGIGVPPDYYAPLTAEALSEGGDPGVDKALSLLR
jgi:carboxyl-terminal processing protease